MRAPDSLRDLFVRKPAHRTGTPTFVEKVARGFDAEQPWQAFEDHIARIALISKRVVDGTRALPDDRYSGR